MPVPKEKSISHCGLGGTGCPHSLGMGASDLVVIACCARGHSATVTALRCVFIAPLAAVPSMTGFVRCLLPEPLVRSPSGTLRFSCRWGASWTRRLRSECFEDDNYLRDVISLSSKLFDGFQNVHVNASAGDAVLLQSLRLGLNCAEAPPYLQ